VFDASLSATLFTLNCRQTGACSPELASSTSNATINSTGVAMVTFSVKGLLSAYAIVVSARAGGVVPISESLRRGCHYAPKLFYQFRRLP